MHWNGFHKTLNDRIWYKRVVKMSNILKISFYIFAILLSFFMGYKYGQFETDFNRTEAVHPGKVTLVYDNKKEILDEGSNTLWHNKS